MSIYIVVTIIILLSGLACYAFISQSVEKKRLQKQRILAALKTKHRNSVHLINGFPANFLPSELTALIYRGLIDTCEQLSKLEPNDLRHLENITLFTNQLGLLPKNAAAQRVRIDNPQQMKEVRQHLQELMHFVTQQEAQKNVTKVQMDSYLDQIKRLNLQMSVDAYIYQGKQAQQVGKLRLAIHFFTLAKKLLTSENATRIYDKQLEQLNGVIVKLEEKAQIKTEPQAHNESAEKSSLPAAKEWEKFKAEPEDSWKKKNIYD